MRKELLFDMVVFESTRNELRALWFPKVGQTVVRPNSAFLSDACLALRAVVRRGKTRTLGVTSDGRVGY